MKKETLFKKLFVLLLFFVYSSIICYSHSYYMNSNENIIVPITVKKKIIISMNVQI